MSEAYRGRRCLVTGGAGFIGSHLVEELVRRGAVVTVADSLSTGRLSNLAAVADRVSMKKMDVARDDLRPLLVDGEFHTIFHLAANANVTASVENPQRDFERNVVATLHLLEAVRHHAAGARVVHTSSATVYGEGRSVPIREDDPLVPISPYGVSKLAAEGYIRIFAQLYGVRSANVRLFSVYGPRLRKQVVYDLMCKLRANPDELFIHGDGTQVRDMNHVANIAGTLLHIAERAPLKGEVYNVAAGEQISIGDLAKMICREMKVKPRLVFSGEVRPGETQAWYPDTSRLEALGYEPRMRLAEGLADTAAWFRTEQDD